MARTADGARLTRRHRTRQIALRAAMLRDLTRLWATVDPVDLSNTIGRFATAGAVLVRTRHRESSVLASRYFRQFRTSEGIDGAADDPRLASAPPVETAQGAIRGAALSGVINARRAGFSPSAAARQGLVKASGSATTLTLNGGRDTVLDSMRADRRVLGYVRVTSGNPCAFCAMLASRGEMDTADVDIHDHCSCQIEPFYEGSEIPQLNRDLRDQWDQAQREVGVSGTSNDPLNAFRRLREGRE